MVIMDNFYLQSRQTELWNMIDKLHLQYLDIEDSPEKLDIRNQLEEFIKEYLCISSHNHKFMLPITYEVLYRSAKTDANFSGYKVATGFNALQLYASNLVSQPWRKEYKQIRKYSGFYKHHIEMNLTDADLILEAMGYRPVGISTLILDGPIGPDKVITVSKDCLIAYVECQILKFIWEEITSSNMKISWTDILDFRQRHLCSPDQTITALKYHHQQKQFYSNPVVTSPMNRHIPPVQSYPSHAMGYEPQMIPQYLYGNQNGCCPNTCAPYAMMRPQFSTNGYYYASPNGFNQPYSPTVVPIAQLIEVEPQNGYDTVDRPSHSRTLPRLMNESDNSEGNSENWDYVYKKLESQGYTKDFGGRPNILPTQTLKKTSEKKISTGRNSLPVAPIKTNTNDVSPASSYDNLTTKKPSKSTGNTIAKIKTITVSDKSTKSNKSSKKSKETWQCRACTYLNDSSNKICEMCSKTRKVLEEEIEVGGAECEQCTLVNPKDAKNCQACEQSLENSPTRV